MGWNPEELDESQYDEQTRAGLAKIKPRQIDPNPRCSCSSKDPNDRAPMFHPAHEHGPCIARLENGDRCPCTAHEAENRSKPHPFMHKEHCASCAVERQGRV